jgi:membrane fusion protein, adhesin transport system
LKAGDPIALFIPETQDLVVELWMNGNDIPLIHAGDKVRLQFEGWPAIQFAGWPSVAIGTFGGKVLLVDATDNGEGKFRILVEPDPKDEPWPSNRYLRQGVRTNGWVLLNQVSLGFELWRQFNGFPPTLTSTPETESSKGGKKK